MKKKALILMSFFAMAMTVALAQNPDKGNGTCQNRMLRQILRG